MHLELLKALNLFQNYQPALEQATSPYTIRTSKVIDKLERKQFNGFGIIFTAIFTASFPPYVETHGICGLNLNAHLVEGITTIYGPYDSNLEARHSKTMILSRHGLPGWIPITNCLLERDLNYQNWREYQSCSAPYQSVSRLLSLISNGSPTLIIKLPFNSYLTLKINCQLELQMALGQHLLCITYLADHFDLAEERAFDIEPLHHTHAIHIKGKARIRPFTVTIADDKGISNLTVFNYNVVNKKTN